MTKLGDLPTTKKNEELTESQQKQEALEPIAGVDWEKLYEKEHKLRQEAEGETTIVKGIGQNSPEMKAAKQKIEELQNELDRIKKDNNDLFLRIAELTEVEESHRNQNGKLQERLTEVEEDNKKLSSQITDQVERARKAGL